MRTILERDAKALESNVNYYMKLLGDSNQINKAQPLFEKLQLDKLRYAYFSEVFIRLKKAITK
jgi:hypothetical protein